MSIEKIVCSVCGYSANYVTVGNKGTIKTHPQEMMVVCKNFGSGNQLNCENLDKALARPRRAR